MKIDSNIQFLNKKLKMEHKIGDRCSNFYLLCGNISIVATFSFIEKDKNWTGQFNFQFSDILVVEERML